MRISRRAFGCDRQSESLSSAARGNAPNDIPFAAARGFHFMNDASAPLAALQQIPAEIHCAHDYEWLAQRFLAAPNYAYIDGGSGQDVTLAANRAAFLEWDIYPRVLADVRDGHTRCHLFGRDYATPILLAPVAFQTLAHPRGELDGAQAAAAMDTCMIASTLSSHPLEAIAAASGGDKWFQLYFQPQRDATLDLVRRAERAGYRALVVTLDASIQLPSLRALRAGFRMPPECEPANLRGYPQPLSQPQAGESRIFQGLMRAAPMWSDFEWLIANTALPVIVKGVLHPDDAQALRARGAAGLIVSNHGGRTLDGAPASLPALRAMRKSVGDDFPLLFDSGVRSGSDVFKALALGADAVAIGRLQLYALAVAGALGVAHVLKMLGEELEACMAMAGCATLADIRETALRPHSSL